MFDSVSVDADRYLTNLLRTSMKERYEAEREGKQLPADLLQNFIGALKAGEQTDAEGKYDYSITSTSVQTSIT
ncbi:hypothetical protein Btru_045781 [Bulinus truncatus]|nr:hypothetical protein Btru_045781 [Bulinus truncatus]